MGVKARGTCLTTVVSTASCVFHLGFRISTVGWLCGVLSGRRLPASACDSLAPSACTAFLHRLYFLSKTTCLLRYPLFLRHSTFLSISLRPSAVNIIPTGPAPRSDACAFDDAPCGAPVITDVTDNRPSSRLSRTAQRTRRVYCCVPGRLLCVGGI